MAPVLPTRIQREILTLLREAEINELQFQPSWERVLAVEPVRPTYRYEFDTISEDIPVTVSPNAVEGAEANFVRERDSFLMQFFLAKFGISWVESWFVENGGQAPGMTPSEFTRRQATLMVNAIRRKMDDYFWDGSASQGINGLKDIDSSPTTMTENITDADGVKAFVKTVIASVKRAEGDLVSGRRVLALDSEVLPELIRPYDDTDSGGQSGLEKLNLVIDEIVGVQNPTMDGLAILHYQNIDNASYLRSIPNQNGVQVRFARDGDNTVIKAFHHAGFGEYRTEGTYTVDSITS